MRILQVHTKYREAGGEDSVVAAEAELLRSGGHEVVQWVGQNPAETVAALKALIKAPSNRRVAAEVAGAAAAAAPDVIHVHNTWYSTSPRVLSELRRETMVPIVMTLHNYRLMCANGLLLRDGVPCELCVGHGPWNAVRYGCYRDSRVQSTAAALTIAVNRRRRTWVDSVDRFLALTGFARGRAIAGGLPGSKVEVKPNFVPDPGPRPDSAEKSDRLLFVGRIAAEKGITTVLRAWQQAPPPGLRLTIAGDGPLFAELAGQHVPGVEMLGRVDGQEVKRLMLESRALLFPSVWYEGMPMTLLEAFAAGLPTMGSRLGSMEEMIAPLGDRWLAAPGSAMDWEQRLAFLTDDTAIRAGSAAARKQWEQHYAPERALQNLENAYRA